MRVVLNGKLYRASAVRSAAAGFAHLARISVRTGKGEIVVEVDDVDPDVGPFLVDELLNHALAETVAQRG